MSRDPGQSPDSNTDGLTDKQRAFVAEYLVDLNATQAAIRAGYSPKTANQQGPENLVKPGIQVAIAAAQQARIKRTHIDQDYVMFRLQREAELEGEGASHSARVSTLALLGKQLQMFKEGDGRPQVPVQFIITK